MKRGPAQRGAFFDHASRWTSYVAIRAGEATFLVSTRDARAGRSLFMNRGRGETAALDRAASVIACLLPEHGHRHEVFVDIGANIGTATVTAIRSRGFRTAIACEPKPETFRVLRLNLLLNGIDDRVRALPVALSSHDGCLELPVDRAPVGRRPITSDSSSPRDDRAGQKEPGAVLKCECVTLDQLVERGLFDAERVGLLRVGARAHEGGVLEGGSALLGRGVPLALAWPPGAPDGGPETTRIASLIGEHYTHFVDVGNHADPLRIWVQPTAQLAREGAGDQGHGGPTDLVVLRLPQR